jgi:O-Antigen ligase
MKLLSIFKPSVFVFGITLCGYGVISFFVSASETSQVVTIPYRLVVLVANLILLLFNLRIIYPKKKRVISTLPRFYNRSIFLLLCFFLLVCSSRMVYDIFLRIDLVLYQDPSQYLIFWFLIILIPSINFLFLDESEADKYLLVTWIFHLLMGVLSLLINPTQSSEFFADKGRLSGVALNPISLGQYGSSLCLLSLFLWFRGKEILARKWNLIYLVSASIGMTVVMLAASRGPIICLVLSTLLLIFTSGVTRLRTVSTVAFLMLSVAFASIFALDRGSSVFDRLLLIQDELDSTGVGRGSLYETTFDVIRNNLLTGCGIQLPDGGYPHNFILESFLPFGLIGGISFILVFSYACIKSICLLNNVKNKWGWVGLIFIQYSISSLSSGSLYSSYVFWYLLFAVFGFSGSIFDSFNKYSMGSVSQEKLKAEE